jgi:hypothetical protein
VFEVKPAAEAEAAAEGKLGNAERNLRNLETTTQQAQD